MSKMALLGALEAEKLTKEKWKQYCRTGQVMTGQVMTGPLMTGKKRTGKVRTS